MEIITFNDCRKCGSKPRVRAFGSLHLVTCPECLEETLSDPDLAVLAKRWNELNPTRSVGITLSKAFSPIKEIRLTARIDDLDLETEPEDEPESEPEDETDMAPESEPCLPPGWSHATAFSENPKIYVWNHGGDPDQESEQETEPERPNLDPGRGPCACPGFNSPLQYQVGGDHYHRFNYQPIQLFRETNLDFDRANAIKYLARLGHKGDPLEDLQKALQYLDFYKVRQDYETARCEEFISQLPDGPIRQAIRYIFKGAMYLAKMSVQEIVNEYLAKETETDET